jgi:hypothetical protein
VIHGIRRRVELVAARAEARAQGLEPVVVWLDRCPLDAEAMEFSRDDADYVLANHGAVGHLAKLVRNMAGEFRTATPPPNPFEGIHRIDHGWDQSGEGEVPLDGFNDPDLPA